MIGYDMYQADLYYTHRHRSFANIFPSYEEFLEEYNDSPLKVEGVNTQVLYYLLYAKHGNDPIANDDENQFMYRLFSIIYMYGPTWAKRLDVQEKIRALSEEDLLKGSIMFYGHALHDGGAPSTSAFEALPYIDNQNTAANKKSKLEGYAMLLSLLETDVTQEFLDRFQPLFVQFVVESPLLYEDIDIDQEVT